MNVYRPEATLKEAAGHVGYEVSMLLLTRQMLRQPEITFREAQPLWINATLEAHLMHLRNVRDFLCRRRSTNPKLSEDLLAEDYFKDPETWRAARVPFERGVTARSDEINVRVAHLSFDRLTGDKRWTGQELTDYVLAALTLLDRFRSELAKEWADAATWFPARLPRPPSIERDSTVYMTTRVQAHFLPSSVTSMSASWANFVPSEEASFVLERPVAADDVGSDVTKES